MKRSTLQSAAEKLRARRQHKNWQTVVTCLAAVVVFVTTYMLILPAITMERETVCGLEEHTHTDACYAVSETLICPLEEGEEHTHTQDCYETEQTLICALEEHTHTEPCYAQPEPTPTPTPEPTPESTAEPEETPVETDAPEASVQPEPTPEATPESTPEATPESTAEPEETPVETVDPDAPVQTYTYEDDTLSVEVTLPEGAGVPEDAVLSVRPITGGDEDYDYDELTRQAEEAVSGQAEEIVLYDISFYTPEEEYIPVADTATVTFRFKQSVISPAAGEVAVLHYEAEADAPVALTDVSVELDGDTALSALSFQTEGFSVFAVVSVSADDNFETVVPDVANLDGQSYLILSYTPQYAMMAAADSTNTNRLAYQGISDLTTASEWLFTASGTGYKISSGGQYLKLGNGSLELTDESNASVFTVAVDADGEHITFWADGYYINSFGGESNMQGFAGWSGLDNGSRLRLYQNTATTPSNLDGKSFAIVNRTSGNYAMTAETFNSSDWSLGVPGLKAQSVDITTRSDGTVYVSGDDITEWTFHAVAGQSGVYTISTEVAGETKYLKMLEQRYKGSETELRGSLTLGDEGTAITVTVTTDGRVLLENGSGSYVNRAGEDDGFWVTAGTDVYSQHYLAQVVTTSENVLLYDLNLPSLVTAGNGTYKQWYGNHTPSLDNIVQEIADGMASLYTPTYSYNELGFAGELYKEQNPGVADEANPYYGLYRMYVMNPGNLVTDNQPTEHMTEEEYLFYWTYTDASNVTHRFKPGAVPTVNADDSVTLTDVTGADVTIPAGSTLTGEWIQVSAPVYFFINYNGTILDTEGDVAGRGNSFLNGTAIGHILFAKETVGSYGTFAQAVHEEISAMFRSKENLDLDPLGAMPTQILIETATTADGEDLTNNEEYGEANARMILAATLSWIQAKSDVDLYISTGNGQTKANQEQLTTDNYAIRWYVVKEQNDAWHIDGVLTAVTKPLVVTKSFAGLTEEQIQSILTNYQIALWIRGNSASATYMTLETTSSGVAGQYSYDGYDAATQTAQWTVRLLAGEHVTLTESGYELTGFVPAAYSVIDGNGASIHTGVSTGYDVAKDESNDVYDVVGGVNGEVFFSNAYTAIGKGSLSLLKKNAATGAVMQGVTFTLEGTDGTKTDTTDAGGRADFMNLEAGTYTLTETTPAGFVPLSKTITVTVAIPEGETHATVTVFENGVEQATGTDALLYVLENEPETNTLIVEKLFKDIKKEEVQALSYKITLSGTGVDETLTLNGAAAGSIAPSYASADGLRYNWVITGVLEGTELTVTESGYGSDNYIDTKVTAEVITGGGAAVSVEPVITTVGTGNTASVTLTTDAAGLDKVTLTNTYTNEFVLYLQKTDTITGQPLQGAAFKLYGSYDEATNAKDTIKYEKAGGGTETLYFIGYTEPSDANGLAKVSGLNLSNEGKTYAYVLSEYQAPDGYAKPSYPGGIVPSDQVITVTVDNVKNNVYSTSMRNQTIGANLIVEKHDPNNGLTDDDEYTMTITITANEPSVRTGNREYEYYIYNIGGTRPADATGTAKGSQPTGVLNTDVCTFEVTLKEGQQVLVKDVPIGYSYTVKEEPGAYVCAMVNGNGTGYYDNANNTAYGEVLEIGESEADNKNTVTVNNYPTTSASSATTNITVTKEWLPVDKAGSQAVMVLYQVTDGATASAKEYETVTLTEAGDWKHTWSDLPLYDGTGTNSYDYYLAEQPVDGYTVNYSGTLAELTVAGETVMAVHATTAGVTVTNTTGYELPASGGRGNFYYTFGGLLLMAAGALMYGYTRRRRERRSKD